MSDFLREELEVIRIGLFFHFLVAGICSLVGNRRGTKKTSAWACMACSHGG